MCDPFFFFSCKQNVPHYVHIYKAKEGQIGHQVVPISNSIRMVTKIFTTVAEARVLLRDRDTIQQPTFRFVVDPRKYT